MPFRFPEHAAIADALARMDADLLVRCRCFFGGGTAIVMQNGEYRLSVDIDFLCSDADGYRELRTVAVGSGARGFFGETVETIREFRADQYGIRAVIGWRQQPIRFEIVRESRIAIDGAPDTALGVPVLAVEDQFAEKLLANADRCLDRAVAFRDAVDLGYLVARHGRIPAPAIAKAEAAYGADIPSKLVRVIEILAEPKEIAHAAETLRMAPEDVSAATHALREAAAVAWPSRSFPVPEGM